MDKRPMIISVLMVLLSTTVSTVKSQSTSLVAILQPSNLVSGESFGRSLATGDVNGDGNPDLIVGFLESDNVAVQVLVGPELQTGVKLTAPSEAIGFGQSLVVADVNGDHISDIVISAPGTEVQGRIRAGEAYLYLGGKFFDGSVASTLAATTPAREEFFGIGLAVGDVNGDGVSDVVVGTTRRALVYFGGDPFIPIANFTVLQADTTAPRVIGPALAIGDINGDGIGDIIGLYLHNRLSIYFGGFPFDDSVDREINQTDIGFDLDDTLNLVVGDVNGDHANEIILGLPNKCSVVVVSNLLQGSVATKILGPPVGCNAFGNPVLVQDVNKDGAADIIVGAELFPLLNVRTGGAVFIYYGSASSPAVLKTPNITIVNPVSEEGTGFSGSLSMITVKDQMLLAVGAPLADVFPGGSFAGKTSQDLSISFMIGRDMAVIHGLQITFSGNCTRGTARTTKTIDQLALNFNMSSNSGQFSFAQEGLTLNGTINFNDGSSSGQARYQFRDPIAGLCDSSLVTWSAPGPMMVADVGKIFLFRLDK
jgi:hypothetical protein